MPRPHRLGACFLCFADCRRPDGGGARRRGVDRMAPARGPCRALRRSRRPAAGASRPRRAARRHGRITLRSREIYWATIPPESSRRSRRRVLQGAAPTDLGRSLAYAAALRVARFGNANEHGDWETAHHVFSYANALHRMLERIGTAGMRFPRCRAGRAARFDGPLSRPLPQRAAGPHPGRGRRSAGRPARGRGAIRPPCSMHSTDNGRLIWPQGWWRGISRLAIRRRR